MRCVKCGAELPDGAAFCPTCGAAQRQAQPDPWEQPRHTPDPWERSNRPADPWESPNREAPGPQAGPGPSGGGTPPPPPPPVSPPRTNTQCIVGLVLSCVALFINFFGLIGLVGLVVSISGLRQCGQRGEGGKVLAIIGIVLGGVSVCFGLFTLVLLALI